MNPRARAHTFKSWVTTLGHVYMDWKIMFSFVILESFHYTAVIIALQAYSSQSIDWCSLDCLTNQGEVVKNTMCKYEHQTLCKNLKSSITPDKRKHLLHLHNEFRNKTAAGQMGLPPAADMRQMSWDPLLEKVALRWARQCKPGYDECRRTPEFQSVGQNYGMLATAMVNPDSSNTSFDGWISWMSKANLTLLRSYQPGYWGAFTQVIWSTTYKLGCAQVQFSEKQKGVNWKRTVVICNYGPAGNLAGSRVFTEGKPCTRCSKGTSCKPESIYPYLCALPADDTQPKPIIDRQDPSGGSSVLLLQNQCHSICILTLFVLHRTN